MVSLSKWLAHFYYRKTNRNLNLENLPKYWSDEGLRCESDNGIFAWRFTWNYTYSPLKDISRHLCTTRGLFFGMLENLLTTLIPIPRARAGGFTIHRPRPPRLSQTLYWQYFLMDQTEEKRKIFFKMVEKLFFSFHLV